MKRWPRWWTHAFVITLIVGFAPTARGQSFNYTWTFTGSPAGSGVVGTGNPAAPAGITLTNFIRTGGATVSNAPNVFESSNWPLNVTSGPAISFTATPTAGNVMYVTGYSFSQQRSADGPLGGSFETPGFSNPLSPTTSAATVTVNSTRYLTAEPAFNRWLLYSATTSAGTYRVDDVNFAGLSQAPTAALNIGAAIPNTTFYAQASPLNLSGILSGSTNLLSLLGANTITLSADNTLTANLASMGGGKLLVNNPGPGAGLTFGGTMTVGGVLGGTGRIAGNLNVASGNTIKPGPGNAVGTLKITGDVTMGTASPVLSIYASNTTASLLQVSGNFDVSGVGNRTISLINDGTLIGGHSYTYTVATMTSTIGFSPANFTVSAANFAFMGTPIVTNPGGTSMQIQFTPAPEPASVLLISTLGLGGLAVVRRRRRASQKSPMN